VVFQLNADGDIPSAIIELEIVPNPARGVAFGLTRGSDRKTLWQIVAFDITLRIHELEAVGSSMKSTCRLIGRDN
jgi:hypothetical protein